MMIIVIMIIIYNALKPARSGSGLTSSQLQKGMLETMHLMLALCWHSAVSNNMTCCD